MNAVIVCGLLVLTFVAGAWYGQRRSRDDHAEQYRTAVAAVRLREYHRITAEQRAYKRIDLTPRPIFEGEAMKVSLN